MNSRERVFASLEHKRPNRVPIHASFVPQLERKLEEYFNSKGPDLYIELGNDLLLTAFIGVADGFYKEESETYQDNWGMLNIRSCLVFERPKPGFNRLL